MELVVDRLTVDDKKRLVSVPHIRETDKEDADAGIGAGYGALARKSEPEITKDGVTEAKAIELKSMSRLVKTPEKSVQVATNSANNDQYTGKLVSDFMNSEERDGVIAVKAPVFGDSRKSTLIDMGTFPVGIVFDDDADLIKLELKAERLQEQTEGDLKCEQHSVDADTAIRSAKNHEYYKLLHENNTWKLSLALKDLPFVARNPIRKAQMLAHLGNDLLMSKESLEKSTNQLRAACVGQDRFWRRYWKLPKADDIFIEARESAQNDICRYQALESMDDEKH
ncbi:GH22409 [Drosophila grimshawi]|uniref:GH22409 n=1 Tax=Drosophila grimshawi TaxID=7222 RepID=B4JZ35_DROGR|nr:GH22409 [Drosophila grimshawi]